METDNSDAERKAFRERLAKMIDVRDDPSDKREGHDVGGSARRLADKMASGFQPIAPKSIQETGVGESLIESLILKFLLNRSAATGRELALQVKLPFHIVSDLLRRMKADQLVVYKSSASMSDYVHELTEAGFERARRFSEQSSYFGAIPVPLSDYIASVAAQSIRKQNPKMHTLRRAFRNLVLGDEMLSQLGQAIASGLGLFLYGSPGNGKTSIACRVTGTFGESLWIPRALYAVGEIIRLFDPNNHEPLADTAPEAPADEQTIDQRWIRIRRPTIVVGGELTMDHLEVTPNPITGVSEAPLQLKSNGGTLVIDDFGRQRITPAELLNRWIVPLEERHDFLNLASGRKIKVPFDQLIIFSTNLEPRELVDEAFLRRIPYKIDVVDPSEAEFCELFRRVADAMGIEHQQQAVDYLLKNHYKAIGRPMRFCHARDLLHQVRVFCSFHGRPMELTPETLDAAVKNYFAVI
ncbi:MAG TPA: AAA family ATPase [Thermoguttaceae bacterium]|nr:AAA family ATPase [Thermoguttaceae bacterium]